MIGSLKRWVLAADHLGVPGRFSRLRHSAGDCVRNSAPVAGVFAFALIGAFVSGYLFHSSDATDINRFADAGRQLLSGDWLHTYHNEWVQAGPVELLLCWLAKTIGHNATGTAIALDTMTVLGIVGASLMIYGRNIRVLLIVVTGTVCLGVVRGVGEVGHIAEPASALLWLFAARDARRGRSVRAGVLVGVSAAFETWGVLGVTVLFLAPRLRGLLQSVNAATVVAAAFYLPFVLGGDFQMFHHHWAIGNTLPAVFTSPGAPFTWPMRLAQAIVVVGCGVSVARMTRRWNLSVWVVPALTSFVRLMTDPVRFDYYWGVVLTLLVIGAAPWFAEPRVFARRLESGLQQRWARIAET